MEYVEIDLDKKDVIKCNTRVHHIHTTEGDEWLVIGLRTDQFKFWCKWCKKIHCHGEGDGRRASHCTNKKSLLYGKHYNIATSPFAFNPEIYKEVSN